jgi:exodeoxyribonuclease VII large subunit
VQGVDAPPQIVAALHALNHYGAVDVILLVRGGGSLEDLWCFNDEQVVRAVAFSPIPIVTGVGHEIDNTLVDFAASQRAPTPSAAAELVATPDLNGIRYILEGFQHRAYNALATKLSDLEKQLHIQQRAVKHLSPQGDIDNARQRTDDLHARLERAASARVNHSRQQLATVQASLRSNDPLSILGRGYAVVTRGGDGKRLTSARDAAPGTALHIQLHDGTLQASVKGRNAPAIDAPPQDSDASSQIAPV